MDAVAAIFPNSNHYGAHPMKPRLIKTDALIIVDVQNDFCPGGKLAIEGGDQVVPMINDWISAAIESEAAIVASCDQHPEGHASFKEQGGPWPEHCVQGTDGADFHPDLQLPPETIVVEKGQETERDQHSAFDDTGLGVALQRKGVRRVYIAGLALDVCVRATAIDAVKNGFDTHLILDATRATSRDAGDKAVNDMQEAGVHINVARQGASA